MSAIGDFQNRVNGVIGPSTKFQIDRPHADKPDHVDLTQILPDIGAADKVEVDFSGNVIGGSTQVGSTKMNW